MDIKKMAYDLKDKLIEMRRYLHQIPELADEEFKTSSYVADKLSKLGIEVKTGIAKTGVVGILKGDGDKTIALRADMDGKFRIVFETLDQLLTAESKPKKKIGFTAKEKQAEYIGER